ncbi:helix-turn-helix domain-containing protein [Streptomyces sp. JNUCC 63]
MIVRATTLAEAFTRLKERSGLSYAAISRKCYLSTSSLHRYFTGQGTPSGPDLVIRIAEACGADAAEVRSVLRCWLGQTSGGQPPAAATATPDAPAEAGKTPASSFPDVRSGTVTTTPPLPFGRGRSRTLVVILVLDTG